MNEHRYILEPYKGMNTRYTCPSCQRTHKTFSRYIDTETCEQIHPSVGRCNRESNCNYHYTPKQYFQDNNIQIDTPQPKAFIKNIITPRKKVSFVPVEIFKQSLQIDNDILQITETNHFVKYLISLFGIDKTNELISKYFIGTSKFWSGATVFWQIDLQGKIRTGKIMLYDATTGKRIKEPFNYINWAHKVIKQPEFELMQCLFGEHLLHEKNKPVAIVESEKTAIIASVYLPQFIWLAVGSLTNLNTEKCNVLKGRNVTLFPDLNGFEKWNNKAKELSHITPFTISDLLELKASEVEKKQGFDLADYLIKFDFNEFVVPELKADLPEFEFEVPERIEDLPEWKNDLPEWSVPEIENFFKNYNTPIELIKLNNYTTILNVPKFIDSHFATVKANQSNETFLPYLNRLHELKQCLTIKIN